MQRYECNETRVTFMFSSWPTELRKVTHQKNNLLIGFADDRGLGLSNFFVASISRHINSRINAPTHSLSHSIAPSNLQPHLQPQLLREWHMLQFIYHAHMHIYNQSRRKAGAEGVHIKIILYKKLFYVTISY